MIRHQAVGVHRALQPRGEFTQVKQIKQVVAVAPEASRTIVAPLSQMYGNAGNDHS
jgi:hypothetical protein